MMVSVESIGGLERRMTVQVPAEQIESEIASRLASVGKTARIKGFRPGKVPMSVIRQRYGGQVRQEVLGELLRSTYAEAIAKESLRPAGGPQIEPGPIEEGKGLEYTATFEVYPEIELKGAKGIAVRRPVAEIGDDDVDRMLEKLRRQRVEWETVERPAADADRVTVDFSGAIDGEPFPGGSGEDIPVVLGEGQMLPDFEAGLAGSSAGDEKDIKVAFPEDYGAPELAGKTADFHVRVRKVEEPRMPDLDDRFAMSFGISEGGLAKLREEVADNMRREMEQTVRGQLREQLLSGLLEANQLELPKVLVEDEVRSLQESAIRRMGGEITEQTQLPPREPLEEPARRRVSLGLLVAEVIRTAEIELDQERARRRVMELAAGTGNPEEALRFYASNREIMDRIEMDVIEEQVVDWLLEHAEVREEQTTFESLMERA
jgi:trigger factor